MIAIPRLAVPPFLLFATNAESLRLAKTLTGPLKEDLAHDMQQALMANAPTARIDALMTRAMDTTRAEAPDTPVRWQPNLDRRHVHRDLPPPEGDREPRRSALPERAAPGAERQATQARITVSGLGSGLGSGLARRAAGAASGLIAGALVKKVTAKGRIKRAAKP